ncbi:MAG: universal stress protein [Bacteroidia bacterium]|nr:universal stress protein [Bacteroidia bacterium]NND12224.1 universal stress protein [Flavobacteriaceae bacterium]NNK28645.1 universal stress protein [Flavobacteriaceae bacterium]
MLNKLLVPTDFSPLAENALKIAAQLARKHDSEIYLLHMLELPLQQIDAMSSHSDLPEAVYFMRLAHKRFEEIMEKDFLKGIKVHETVNFHETSDGILETCAEYNIDLVVMGSHGAHGFKEMFIGSNTEKVVRTSNVPVLVIKNEHLTLDIKEFVYASSFTEENKAPFKKAVALANMLNARMHLLVINTINNFYTTAHADDLMKGFIADSKPDEFTLNIYNDETIEKGILNFSKLVNADLIGMSTHGRQGLAHFFNGSISEDLVNHARRPVITFKM